MINALYNKVKKFDQFYIIGTNTDVGKTFTGTLLLKEYLENDSRIMALKPLETGLEGAKVGPDTLEYLKMYKKFKIDVRPEDINLFSMSLPASPHLSQQLEQKKITVKEIVAWLEKKYFSFIELAGGLFVPINERETQFDLLKAHKRPVVLVTYSGLGILNQVLSTAYALDGFEIIIVMNKYNPDDIIQKTNYEYLNKRFDVVLF